MSGNPGGRPKLSPEQREQRIQAQAVLDKFTADAAWTLVELMQNGCAEDRRLASADILNRSGLKGVDRLELTGKDGGPVQHDLKKLSDKELAEFRKLIAKTEK